MNLKFINFTKHILMKKQLISYNTLDIVNSRVTQNKYKYWWVLKNCCWKFRPRFLLELPSYQICLTFRQSSCVANRHTYTAARFIFHRTVIMEAIMIRHAVIARQFLCTLNDWMVEDYMIKDHSYCNTITINTWPPLAHCAPPCGKHCGFNNVSKG